MLEQKVSRSRLCFDGAGDRGYGVGKGSLMNRKAVIILVIIVVVILLVLLVIYAANLTSGYKPY
jgi:flagellar biosynthesis/type III secretory pathway M-ring protein FliF/YscJ